MKRKELQELVTELQDISNALYLPSESDGTRALMRLCTLMARLKNYPQYSAMADNVLDAIEAYSISPDHDTLMTVVAETESLIEFFNEKLENSLVNTLRKGYKEAKDIIDETIPEEVKDVCKETVDQVKVAGRKVEKSAKSRLRSWLLSDDDEE